MNSHGKRAQYNYGEAVTSKMFQVDQTYHIRQREAWNKALSGWGVIGDGFQLRYDSTLQKATVSGGIAIAADGQALWSDSAIESSQFNPAADERFEIVCIKRGDPVPCGKVPSIDGENEVFTAWEDLTIVEINAVAAESDIPEKVQQLAGAGCIVVGTLEKVDGKWVASNKHRHQGPIDPPGGKDAARIANAISVSGAVASGNAIRLRKLLLWLIGGGVVAISLVGLLWTYTWYLSHVIPLPEPYRIVAIDSLEGPVQGTTFRNDKPPYDSLSKRPFLGVQIQDREGAPVQGIDIEFKLSSPPNDATEPFSPKLAPKGAVFVRAGKSDSSVVLERPQYAVVKTNANGIAYPPGIRFASGADDERVQIDIAATQHKQLKLPPIVRNAAAESIGQIEFVGHFVQTHSFAAVPDLAVAPTDAVQVDIRERVTLKSEVTVLTQTLDSSGAPVSVEWDSRNPGEVRIELWQFKRNDENGKYDINKNNHVLTQLGASDSSEKKLGESVTYRDTFLEVSLPWNRGNWKHGEGLFLFRLQLKADPSKHWDLAFEVK